MITETELEVIKYFGPAFIAALLTWAAAKYGISLSGTKKAYIISGIAFVAYFIVKYAFKDGTLALTIVAGITGSGTLNGMLKPFFSATTVDTTSSETKPNGG